MIKQYRSFNFNRIIYIVFSVIISIIGFSRSYVMMKYFNFESLGIITIIQTIISLVSVMQFGLINGGYRLVSVDKSRISETNNIIYSFILIVLIVAPFPLIIIMAQGFYSIKDLQWIFVGIIAGVFLLAKNWTNNLLIAIKELNVLNNITLITNLFSLSPLFFIDRLGLWAGIISISVQPILFIAFSFLKTRSTRPTQFFFSIKSIRHILSFGFIPFVIGIIEMFNLQIERWGMTFYLGIEDLGKFYLPSIYASIFLIIPSALNNILFPDAMQTFVSHNKPAFYKLIRNYYILITIYSIFVIIVTLLFMNSVIGYFLPRHLPYTKLVYYILPGLIGILYIAPINLYFNASVKLIPMLIVYSTSVLFNTILLFSFNAFEILSLENFAIFRSIIGLFILTGFIISFKILNNGEIRKI